MPKSEEKKTPSSSSEPRGAAPPSRTIRVTTRAKRPSRSSSRGSSGSVITAVLLVAKISASGTRRAAWAPAGAARASAATIAAAASAGITWGGERWFIMRATLLRPAPRAHRQALPNLRAAATDPT